ncbi:RICIN domain-containing protein [Streptomyces sp. NPDC004520]|uniref:RICIN domain-containing protein n=1 Tax=Streptomyces sp. NPDC004520 TaxID=3364702 RepID=UPI0036BD5316
MSGNSYADPGDFLLVNANSGRCLSVPGAATSFAYLNQFSCNNYADQFWYLKYQDMKQGVAWYTIRNRHSGLCLSVDAAQTENFARATQYPCGVYADQFWRIDDYDANTRGYHVKNWNSGKCLAVLDGSQQEAASVIIYQCGSWPDHYWRQKSA